MSDSAAFGEYACLAEGDNCNCPSLEPQARARAQGVSSDSVDQRISAKDEPELFPPHSHDWIQPAELAPRLWLPVLLGAYRDGQSCLARSLFDASRAVRKQAPCWSCCWWGHLRRETVSRIDTCAMMTVIQCIITPSVLHTVLSPPPNSKSIRRGRCSHNVADHLVSNMKVQRLARQADNSSRSSQQRGELVGAASAERGMRQSVAELLLHHESSGIRGVCLSSNTSTTSTASSHAVANLSRITSEIYPYLSCRAPSTQSQQDVTREQGAIAHRA